MSNVAHMFYAYNNFLINILIFAVLELWLIQLYIDCVQFLYILFAVLLKLVRKRYDKLVT